MKRSWTARVEVKASSIQLRVWEVGGGLALRAELPRVPDHPRALLWLLEGLALWSGAPLSAVISAGGFVGPSLDFAPVDDEGWPEESALVRFYLLERGHRLPLSRRRKGGGFESGGSVE